MKKYKVDCENNGFGVKVDGGKDEWKAKEEDQSYRDYL